MKCYNDRNNKKKILYIHHGKGLGGAPLSLLYLIKALDTTKYHPIVLLLHDSEIIDLYKKNNIEVYGPTNTYDFPHTKIWWFRWYHAPYLTRSIIDTVKTYFYTARSWLKLIKPDIVHLNTSSLIAWAAIARKKNIPVIWHIREPLASGYFGLRKKLIISCVKKYSTAIVPICHNDAQPWAHEAKTHVVYNAVDPVMFNFKPAQNSLQSNNNVGKNKTILFLGGLSQEKGTLVIFQAFEKLLTRMPEAQLLVAGYFDLPELLEISQASGIKNFLPASRYKKIIYTIFNSIRHATVLLGPITNVPAIMSKSNVIVFPATVGHFARPVIEAGFMKKPVIASSLPPLNELVIDGKTGFLVNSCHIDLWTDKLYEILTNQVLANQMGEQAYTYCLEKFSLEKHIDAIEKIYSNKS